MIRRTVAQGASLAFVTAVTASFSMTSFVMADTITNTGPNSRNKIKSTHENKCDIHTNNNVNIKNENKQKAESGDISIKNESKKDDEHDKWDQESPKDAVQPTSIEATDEGQKPGSNSEDQSTESTEQPSVKSDDHEKGGNVKIGDVKTGNAVNTNESHFNVNIETDNECFPKKKAPNVHKPGQKTQPSMKPKVAPSKAAAPQVSAGAGQGVSGGGQGAGVAPSVSQAQQPVAQPIQHQAPKQAVPRPPEHVSNNFTATTTNNVSISNSNYQSAESGSAKVSNNTHVGDVSTGDAVNDNSTSARVNIETTNNSH